MRSVPTKLRFGPNLVAWTVRMQPHQQSLIVITYASRGMDYFYYQIPIQREIKDFVLTLTIDRAFRLYDLQQENRASERPQGISPSPRHASAAAVMHSSASE